MNPEQLKKIILTVAEGLEQKIDGLSGEISTVRKQVPNIDKILARIKLRVPKYGKDWKLGQEEIEQIAEKIKPIVGRDFVQPKDGKDAVITEALITKIVKAVQLKVRDGKDGKPGKDGADGVDGLDGSPDEPNDIVKKLNTTENAVDWKVLKNFNSLVNQDTLKKAVQTLENQTRYLLQKSSGNGLTSVVHDSTLTGDGTSGSPLSVVSTGGTPAAPDTSIQFNNGGVFGGDANFTFDVATETVLLTGTDIFIPTAGSVVFGAGAGNHTMTGVDNILIGGKDDGFANVGLSLTTGEENVFIGKGTGRLMQASSRNVIIGSGAGANTGSAGTVGDNVIVGRGTGSSLGLASGVAAGNVLIGVNSGTTINASYNIAIGHSAMTQSTGAGNIALGFSALAATTSGINIGIGDSVGQSITTGTANILIGSIAGNSLLTNSSNNTMIGYQSGSSNQGNRNTYIGSLAGTWPLGDDNTVVGYSTFNASGSGLAQTIYSATVLGASAMADPRTGADYTTAIGFEALKVLTTGGYNTALGANAGDSVTTGSFNTIIGANAGVALTLGSENTFIGMSAASSMTGASNITSGNFIGGMYTSVNRTSGNFNTIIGTRADSGTSTGDSNTIYGYGAGAGITSGASNIMIGALAGGSITQGQGIFIGVGADGVNTGIGQIAIGASATTTASNQFVVGSVGTPINDYYFGEGVTSASPSNITFNATGGSGTDIAGADFIIAGGKSTGTGIGGDVIVQTSPAGGSGIGVNGLQEVILFDGNGNVRAARLHNNTTVQGSASEQDIRSGTYTPTLTGVANISSSTARQAQWSRVGNFVTVSGQIDITSSSNNTETTIGISLPVASNFTTAYQLGGTAHTTVNSSASNSEHAGIYADPTANRAELDYWETKGAAETFTYHFSYEVI